MAILDNWNAFSGVLEFCSAFDMPLVGTALFKKYNRQSVIAKVLYTC